MKSNNFDDKRKLAEERKKRLDRLQKTTRELAKASVKLKNTHVPNESKTDRNIPTKSNMPEINMTWSPPPPLPKVKNLIKTLKTENKKNLNKKLTKDLENDNDERLNATKNNKTISQTNTETPSKLINKKPQIYKVTKPEDLFSKLNIVIDSNILTDLTSTNSVNSDTSLILQDHGDVSVIDGNYQINDSKQQGRGDFTILNKKRSSDIDLNTKLIENVVTDPETFADLKLPDKFDEEICHSKTKQEEDDVKLNRKKSFDIDSCTKLSDNINIDSEKHLDLKFPKRDNKEIIQNIDQPTELQELSIDQCLSNKNCNLKTTQTDESNDLLSLFSFFSRRSPPPMNFTSVLKCKYRLQELQSEKDNLESYKPVTSLNKKEFTISNNVNVDKIYNTNNTKSTGTNRQNVIDNDNTIYLENSNQNKQENNLYNCTSSFIDETIKSDHNIDLSLNHIIEDNKEKLNTVNNDKPFSNIKTNEDIKQLLKKLNRDFDSLTKNHCYNTGDLHIDCESLKSGENNLSDKSFSRFSEIRDEFKAELNILDQLNDSLCDKVKMSCDVSLSNND